MKGIYDKFSKILEELVEKEFGISLGQPLWELPKDKQFGDLSSMAALKLASRLKKDPLEIAILIKISLEKSLAGYVEKIEIVKPGFINVFISKSILKRSLAKILEKKSSSFRQNIKRKTLIEFLSANPTGPLSIAHGRQAVVGDVIANILEFCGNKVTKEYYINDAGRQIDLLVESIESLLDSKGEKKIPEAGYKGEYIKDIANLISNNKKYKVNPKKFGLRKFILKHILDDLIKKDLNYLGISFDSWISQEKIIAGKKVQKAIEILNKKGLIYEKEGASWFKASQFGDDKDRVIKKADSELTYFASDIAYHKDKISRKHDKLINLWGPDHHGYIKRLESAIRALGYKKEVLEVVIIQLVTLKTKERMSKRSGKFIPLADLIADIGKDATRFYYLTRKNSSHLEFDIDLAKKTSFDNPLYYIQYVCARITSIFKKAKVKSFEAKFNKFLVQDEELDLLRALLQFSYCLEKAYYSLEPVFIIEFLKDLASSFHKFYEKVRVIDKDKNTTRARLNLLFAVQTVFCSGLKLLGIKPAKKM
jgi:arginyl-tRNA synthetase